MDVEAVTQATELSYRHRRIVAILIGIAAITAAVDATLQLQTSKQQERYDLMASRIRSTSQERDVTRQAFGALSVSVLSDLIRFRASIKAHLKSENVAAHAIALAERHAYLQLAEINTTIQETPSDPRLPDFARNALSGVGSEGLTELGEASSASLAKANSYQSKSDGFGLALFLIAIATALLALAGVAPPSRAGIVAIGVASLSLAGNIALSLFALAA